MSFLPSIALAGPGLHRVLRASVVSLSVFVAACGGGGGDTQAAATAPQVTVQPAATSTTAGGAATFTVSASGNGITYQWQFSIDQGATWANIAGATDASYIVALVRAYMSGWLYRVALQAVGTPASPTYSTPAKLSVASGSGAALSTFTSAADGQTPASTPILGLDGNLYGTTYAGGSNGTGTLYKVTPAGVRTVLHAFGGGTDGSTVLGGLVQAADGTLYGTTSNGGSATNGTVFKATTAGVVTVIHSFTGGAGGAVPYAGVSIGQDGNLYGTTAFGGSYNKGTVFRVTPSGERTVLHEFGGPGDGQSPKAEPIQGADGKLYGVAGAGGVNGNGMIYTLGLDGTYAAVYSFAATGDGRGPTGRLLPLADGSFYGTTYYGGSRDAGTIFKLSATGAVSVLHSFGAAGDGQNPYAGLILGRDGQLYGTSNGGGSKASGTVFRYPLGGAESVVYSFSGAGDGRFPTAGLVQASNGALYGACQYGGDGDRGVVFELLP